MYWWLWVMARWRVLRRIISVVSYARSMWFLLNKGIIATNVMLAMVKPIATVISNSSSENPRCFFEVIKGLFGKEDAGFRKRPLPCRTPTMGADRNPQYRQQSGLALLHRVTIHP